MLIQIGYLKNFSVGLYKPYSLISCNSSYNFPSLSKRFPWEKWFFLYALRLLIMESLNSFHKRLTQVGKCITAISMDFLDNQFKTCWIRIFEFKSSNFQLKTNVLVFTDFLTMFNLPTHWVKRRLCLPCSF